MKQGINYIKKRLQDGASEEEIKKSLADGGWSAHHIETAFKQAKPAVSPNQPWTNMPTPQNLTDPSSSLPGFISILKDALSVYTSKVATLTAILIPIVVVFAFSIFLPSAISNLFANNAIAGMVIFAVVMLNMLLLILACVSTSVAYIYVLSSNEKVSARQAFRKAFSRDFFAICWLSFLAALIIGGGYGLFIIPGIIFMVWFFMASYIFFNENVRGMNAMLKSKEYVRGMWWPVFLRMLPIILISLLFSFLSQYAVSQLPAGNIWVVTGVSLLSSAISVLVITPILLSYYLVLYNKIREKKGEISFVPSTGKKALFILLGIAGIAVGSYLFVTSAPYIAKTLISIQSSNVRLEEYTAPDKSFSVLLPANSTTKDNETFGAVNQGLYLAVISREYPSALETGKQDTDLLNFTKGFTPKLTYFSDYRAVDYSGSSSGLYIKGRVIIVGSRLYNLQMLYRDSSYYNETLYNQFINSFKILSQNNQTSQ